PTGSLRIAGMDGDLHHAASLHSVLGAEGAAGVNVAGEVAVLPRIGIDQAGDGAILVGDFGLHAAPARSVAREDDLPLDVDSALLEIRIVIGDAIVDVDQRSGDVARVGVGVVGGKLPLIVRVRIFRDGG